MVARVFRALTCRAAIAGAKTHAKSPRRASAARQSAGVRAEISAKPGILVRRASCNREVPTAGQRSRAESHRGGEDEDPTDPFAGPADWCRRSTRAARYRPRLPPAAVRPGRPAGQAWYLRREVLDQPAVAAPAVTTDDVSGRGSAGRLPRPAPADDGPRNQGSIRP